MALSYAHGVADLPLSPETLGELLDRVSRQHPSTEALVSVFENTRYSYRELRQEVDCCARALVAMGVEKGDRVGIWSTNCVPWVLLQFGTARIGAVLVSINPAYRSYELEYTLKQCECNLLILGEGFKDALYAAVLQSIVPRLAAADPHRDYHLDELPHLRRTVSLASRPGAGLLSWSEFISCAEKVPPATLDDRQASLDFDDVINIQYTSGTTGFPKGAMLTHHNLVNNGFWIGERMRLTSCDRLCIPVPFYHCFGMVLSNLACVTHGATMVLPAPHFSPLHTLETAAREHCTALNGVPTMFVAELQHPRFREFDLSSLRTGIMAGAPCPAEVMKRVMTDMHCPEITIACGMTETSPVCNMTEVDDPIEVRVGTVGKVMPHQEQKIVDPATGRILPRGEAGELCYRGYNLMRGYYNNPSATRAMIRDGWLHGGDIAVMDDRGYVQIQGRLKDMICRGGEKIFPREVEEFLYTHPKVAEVAVIGVPDSYYGEQVMAWVRLREGQHSTAEEIQSFCRGRIMDYKIPRFVKFTDDFPKTVTGKVQKFRMREISVSELGMVDVAQPEAA
jgi:fatty-acyl-CoA synthase